MKGEYVIRIGNDIITYYEYDDIPESFDHLIKYSPIPILPPHTQEQHDEMESYVDKLNDLMKRETK